MEWKAAAAGTVKCELRISKGIFGGKRSPKTVNMCVPRHDQKFIQRETCGDLGGRGLCANREFISRNGRLTVFRSVRSQFFFRPSVPEQESMPY